MQPSLNLLGFSRIVAVRGLGHAAGTNILIFLSLYINMHTIA
jgi:hypothetical protein